MLIINNNLSILEKELKFSAIRAQGAGGQNVNKVSSAIQLRFNIHKSSLPGYIKQKLLGCGDRRITNDGYIVIKAQEFRSQERNREAAKSRLQNLIRSVCIIQKKRISTKPSSTSKIRRLDEKTRRGRIKKLRSKGLDRE